MKKRFFNTFRKNIKYGLVSLLMLPFFLGGISNAWDLLRQIIEPARQEEIIIEWGSTKETVGKHVFKGGTTIELGLSVRVPKTDGDGNPVCRLGAGRCSPQCSKIESNNTSLCRREWEFEWGLGANAGIEKEPSMIVKITRMLLLVTIALAVTMILYNALIYVVQVGQGKDAKSLGKNIAYIVIGILIALFSVIIMRVIQSISTTIADHGELPTSGYQQDRTLMNQNNKGIGINKALLNF